MKKRQQKKQRKNWDFGGMAVTVFALAIFLTILGLTWTMSAIDYVTVSKEPTAILASAGVSDGTVVSLPVMYYDQKMDDCVNLYDLNTKKALEKRQFEWSQCEYYYGEVEQGIVDYELDEEHLPVALGGDLVTNRGVKGDNFWRWFHATDGESVGHAGILKMNYIAEGAEFSFYKQEFYPLDGTALEGEPEAKDGHNHLFTMNLALPFRVLRSGEERLEIIADDDTWVYVDDKLAIDMGGVHDATIGRFEINEEGEVYASVGDEDLAFSGVVLEQDEDTVIRIFHADRNVTESTFDLVVSGVSLTVMNSEIAGSDETTVQVAYDPDDPSYVAPLGESIVFQPDNSKGLMVMATVFGVLVVAFSMFMMIAVRSLVKRNARK